jgi:hypothetical protein
MRTAVTGEGTPAADRRPAAPLRRASMLALITAACLAPASQAAAHTARDKPAKVTKAEYASNESEATKATAFVSRQITKLHVYVRTCKIVKSLGSRATAGFDEALDIERSSLTDKLHEVNGESALDGWAKGLATRAAAYTGSHEKDLRSAGQDIVRGLADLSDALSKLISQSTTLAGLSCDSTGDLSKAVTARGRAGKQLNHGFGELANAIPGVKPPAHST